MAGNPSSASPVASVPSDSELASLAGDGLCLPFLLVVVGLTGLIAESLFRRFFALASLAEVGDVLFFFGTVGAAVPVGN